MAATTKLRAKYPVAFKRCIPEALKYGSCVAGSLELRAKECEKEFQQLNRCFESSLKSIK